MAVSLLSGARSRRPPPWQAKGKVAKGVAGAISKGPFVQWPGPGVTGGAPPPAAPSADQWGATWRNPFLYGAPDYSSLIGGDWEVILAEGNRASALGRAKAQYRQSLNQALIDLGVTDLGQLGKFGEYVDQDTISKAAANKYSTMAQIANQARKSTTQSSASLAARGILSSGQNVENRETITEGAEQARYTAMRDFLSGAETGLTGLGDLEAQLDYEIAKARGAAGARAAETYPWDESPDPFTGSTIPPSAWTGALKAGGAPPLRKPPPKRVKQKKNKPGKPGFRPF